MRLFGTKPEVEIDTDQRLDTIVRRYVDLGKYIDMLLTREMYLRRADKFADRFEGALTPAVRRALQNAHKTGGMIESADEYYRRARMGHFVSCWNHSAKDNMALWQLYGGASSSVALSTTVNRLVAAASRWDSETCVRIKRVNYIDHAENPDMIVWRASELLEFKHEAYKFEDEMRVIVPRQIAYADNPDSLRLPLGDLNDFLVGVVVAPEAPDSFFNVVEDVTRKYGVTCHVKRSKLTYLP